MATEANAKRDVKKSEQDAQKSAPETSDSLTFSNEVIEKIVACACLSVDGVADMRQGFVHRVKETFTGTPSKGGVEIEIQDDGSLIITIAIVMKYGAYAPAVFEAVREAVTEEVKAMTDLTVSTVNLRIEDVWSPDDSASLA